jgi:hypothetical protein
LIEVDKVKLLREVKRALEAGGNSMCKGSGSGSLHGKSVMNSSLQSDFRGFLTRKDEIQLKTLHHSGFLEVSERLRAEKGLAKKQEALEKATEKRLAFFAAKKQELGEHHKKIVELSAEIKARRQKEEDDQMEMSENLAQQGAKTVRERLRKELEVIMLERAKEAQKIALRRADEMAKEWQREEDMKEAVHLVQNKEKKLEEARARSEHRIVQMRAHLAEHHSKVFGMMRKKKAEDELAAGSHQFSKVVETKSSVAKSTARWNEEGEATERSRGMGLTSRTRLDTKLNLSSERGFPVNSSVQQFEQRRHEILDRFERLKIEEKYYLGEFVSQTMCVARGSMSSIRL